MKFVEMRIDVLGIPHSFLHIEDTATNTRLDRGFTPIDTALSGPGKIDIQDHKYQSILYRTELTDQQYNDLLKAIDESSNSSPYYDLPVGAQCAVGSHTILEYPLTRARSVL